MNTEDEIVVSTKETPGTFDAFETAKPGEPLFTLQGGDALAPATIHHWVQLARAKAATLDGEARDRLLRRATVAENVAWDFTEYRKGAPEVEHNRPEEEQPVPSYSGAAVPQDEDSLRRTRLIRAAEKLNGAVAVIAEVAQIIEEIGFADPSMAAQLHGFGALVRNAAAMIEPRRGSERS